MARQKKVNTADHSGSCKIFKTETDLLRHLLILWRRVACCAHFVVWTRLKPGLNLILDLLRKSLPLAGLVNETAASASEFPQRRTAVYLSFLCG